MQSVFGAGYRLQAFLVSAARPRRRQLMDYWSPDDRNVAICYDDRRTALEVLSPTGAVNRGLLAVAQHFEFDVVSTNAVRSAPPRATASIRFAARAHDLTQSTELPASLGSASSWTTLAWA